MKTFQKERKALIVTALSLILALTCMCPTFAATRANADEGTATATQRQVYYYSDTGNIDSIISMQMSSIGIPLANYHKMLVRNGLEVFMQDFNNHVGTLSYSGIQNAYIIFELQTNLMNLGQGKTDDTYLTALETFCQNLKQMFSALKANNCKIMLVSNTEEVMLYQTGDSLNPNNAVSSFFNYVDVHVSLDLMSLLALGISQKIGSASEYTFYMDVNSNIFLQYMLNFLRYKFDLRDENNQRLTHKKDIYEALYNNQQAFIYAQTPTPASKYQLLGEYDETGVSYTEYYLNELLDNPIFVGKVAAFCLANTGNVPSSRDFLTDMNDLRDAYGQSFDYFIYNANSIPLEPIVNLEDIYSIWYNPSNFLSADISPIQPINIGVMIKDFLQNKSMAKYNNWLGRAAVNYKPISMGEDGWIEINMLAAAYEAKEPLQWLTLWEPILEED